MRSLAHLPAKNSEEVRQLREGQRSSQCAGPVSHKGTPVNWGVFVPNPQEAT